MPVFPGISNKSKRNEVITHPNYCRCSCRSFFVIFILKTKPISDHSAESQTSIKTLSGLVFKYYKPVKFRRTCLMI